MSELHDLLYKPLDDGALGYPIKWPNRTLAIPNDDKWLEVIHQPNGAARAMLGDIDPDQGLLRIGVHWPVDQGDEPPHAVCLQVAALYPKALRLIGSTMRLEIYEKPAIGGAIEDGQSVFYPVSIRYRVFY